VKPKDLDYENIAESQEVPGINFELLLCCINLVDRVDAIKTFQQALKND
jgi:hypothetical protein